MNNVSRNPYSAKSALMNHKIISKLWIKLLLQCKIHTLQFERYIRVMVFTFSKYSFVEHLYFAKISRRSGFAVTILILLEWTSYIDFIIIIFFEIAIYVAKWEAVTIVASTETYLKTIRWCFIRFLKSFLKVI